MRGRSLVLLLSIVTGCVYHDLSPDDETPVFICDPVTISWRMDILPIMETYCAKSGCHDGITRLDWTDYNRVKEYASGIRSRTQDRSMPFDEPMPQTEIDKITCWVNAGALNN